ncbi:MAG TPA: S1/P1 nuclease [bacterium]|nr:S1/P1 nuclease [bacterium]
MNPILLAFNRSFARLVLGTCVCAGFFAASSPSGAWGRVGHQTVAYIAQDQLTPQARKAVQDILGPGEDLASVSTWADTIVKSRPETAPWHFFNLDVRQSQGKYDIADVCKNHDCVVDQIEKDYGILGQRFASRREKREVLKFLVHFLGDIHQPLHCADDKDRGGNEKWFRYYGPSGHWRRYTWVNFHSFWDNLLEPKAKENPRRLASRLEKRISPQDEKSWAHGKALDWAYESFLIAQNDIYKGIPEGPLLEKNRWGKDLPEDYYSPRMRGIVDRQLEKAGVRLAFLLNTLFSTKNF